MDTSIDYKYSEDKLVKELAEYINRTYDEHYSSNKYQATEFIIDGGHGIGFTIGNILKYAQRYGHKGLHPDWRKDLMKVLHYGIIALHIHDLEYGSNQTSTEPKYDYGIGSGSTLLGGSIKVDTAKLYNGPRDN